MKVNQEEVIDRQTVLNIELEDEDLDPYLDRGYRRVVQRTVIPGFRKGKAPRRIVENFLGRENLLNEVLDSMLPEVTSQAIDRQELEAAGLPRIELLNLTPLTLKATVPLKPEIDLGAYREIRIDKDSAEVTAEDVQERLEQLQHSMASWEPVERAVKMGDMVTMEATGTVDERTILTETDAVYFLDEDSTRPFPGFSQKLEDLVLDEAQEFTLDIPEDFPDTAIAGKEAHFSVTIKEIKERVLAEIDDEFAKSVGDDYETIDALRENVEQELKTEAENKSKEQHNESIVKALVEGATIELPPLIVEHEVDHMEENRQMVLQRINVRMDDYLQSVGKTQEEMRGEMETEAIESLNRAFVLSKVAELEGVEVTDEEVEEKTQSLLSEYDDEAEKPEVTDDMRDSVRRMLLSEKIMDRLVSIAKNEAPPLAEPESEPAAEEAEDSKNEETPQEETTEEGEKSDDAEA